MNSPRQSTLSFTVQFVWYLSWGLDTTYYKQTKQKSGMNSHLEFNGFCVTFNVLTFSKLHNTSTGSPNPHSKHWSPVSYSVDPLAMPDTVYLLRSRADNQPLLSGCDIYLASWLLHANIVIRIQLITVSTIECPLKTLRTLYTHTKKEIFLLLLGIHLF